MTVRYWAAPISGSWDTASAWNPAGVPITEHELAYGTVSPDNVFFDTGSSSPYTITGSGDAATLTVSGDDVTFDKFELAGYTGNVVIENGANVAIDSTSSISTQQSGVVAHMVLSSPSASFNVTGATLSVAGILYDADGTVGSDGTLNVDGGQVTPADQFSLASGGAVDVTDGGVLTATNQFSLASGGTVDVTFGGVLTATSQTTLDGNIDISGTSIGKFALESEVLLGPPTAGAWGPPYAATNNGTITVGANGVLQSSAMNNAGSLTLSGGVAVIGENYGTISGYGTVNFDSLTGTIPNDGLIEANGGTLQLSGGPILPWDGSLQVDSLSTLQVPFASENVVFNGYGGTLAQEDSTRSFPLSGDPFIAGFGFADSFHFIGQAATSLTTDVVGYGTLYYPYGTYLDLYNGSKLVDELLLVGQYSASDFAVYSDGHGGTYVTDIDDLLPPIPGLTDAVSTLKAGINAGNGASALQDFLQTLAHNPMIVPHSS